MVTHHIRVLEDKIDYDLHAKGWRPAGVSLWEHTTRPNHFFTKEAAINIDVGNYRSIENEHAEMLECLLYIGSNDGDCSAIANDLLSRLNYLTL